MDKASLNKVILLGRLGRDPEVRYLPTESGERVLARFTLATTRVYKKGGTYQEETEWHSIHCWGDLAKWVGEYLRKGRQILVEGRLRSRRWEQDGQTRKKVEIVAEKIVLLGRKEESIPEPAAEEFPAEPPDLEPSEPDDEVPF